MQSRSTPFALCVIAGLAWARGAAAQSAPDAFSAQMHLSYAAYAAGLNVLRIGAGFDLNPRSYRIEVDYRTAGMFGAIVHGESQSIAAGLWDSYGVRPSRFYAYGHLRGEARRTLIDYQAGQPIVRTLEPPPEEEREPVPTAMQRDTVDTLSAIAALVRTVALTGHCSGAIKTFDGRRVSEIAVRDGGEVVLNHEEDTIYGGPALRCDFDGRQTAGFVRDADRAELARPQHGVAWLAHIEAGAPMLPVRMSFHTRFFGDATMYLTGAGQGAEPVKP